MEYEIKDGVGTGNKAKVRNHRLYTSTVSLTELDEAVKEGDGYNINTGEITLTDAAETPVLYLKNNETNDLHINTLIVGFGTSTDGSTTEMIKINIVRNPTAGTIVSGATDVDIISNRHFGSTNELLADAYKGATGNTMTDGTDHILAYQSDFGRTVIPLSEIIPKTSSLGIKITPPTGNTSLTLYVALVLHIEGDE